MTGRGALLHRRSKACDGFRRPAEALLPTGLSCLESAARCRAPNCAQIQWCESERMHPMPQPLVSHRLSCSPKLPPYAGALHGTLGHGEADWPKASPGSLDSSQKPGSSEGLSCRRLVYSSRSNVLHSVFQAPNTRPDP